MIKLLLFITQLHHELINYLLIIHSKYNCYKGRTIRKLMRGAGEAQKKNSRKGKLNEKKFMHAN